MTYQDIFEQKTKFRIINSYVDELYQFQPNEDKGEFINENGLVVAQLIEANPSNNWFSVAGVFMGEITLKALQYADLIIENTQPQTTSQTTEVNKPTFNFQW